MNTSLSQSYFYFSSAQAISVFVVRFPVHACFPKSAVLLSFGRPRRRLVNAFITMYNNTRYKSNFMWAYTPINAFLAALYLIIPCHPKDVNAGSAVSAMVRQP